MQWCPVHLQLLSAICLHPRLFWSQSSANYAFANPVVEGLYLM